jgi:hypothetical protein
MNIGKRYERILICLALILPFMGPFLGAVIEDHIIGMPVETRVPVVGAYTWVFVGVVGVVLGFWHSRTANRRRWLGVVAVGLNLISLLGLSVIYPSMRVVNRTAIRAKHEQQIARDRQQSPGAYSSKAADGLTGNAQE